MIHWFESILYGFVSGIAEFLPISSRAHQHILMQLFGIEQRDPLMDLMVNLGLLLSILFSCRVLIGHLRREQALGMRGRRGFQRNTSSLTDILLVRQATLPMILGIVLLTYITSQNQSMLATAAYLFLNGMILFFSGRMLQGNKNSGSMSALDSALIGISGALSAICGFSRIGCSMTASILRGAKKQNALAWTLLLGIPALGTFAVLNLFTLFSNLCEIQLWGNFFSYVLAGLAAFSGGCAGISLIKFLITRVEISSFSYYSWGAAMFSFIIYLTVV